MAGHPGGRRCALGRGRARALTGAPEAGGEARHRDHTPYISIYICICVYMYIYMYMYVYMCCIYICVYVYITSRCI